MILGTVMAAGLLSVTLLAPNLPQVLKQLSGKKRRYRLDSISRSRDRLIDRGLLLYSKGFIEVTEKGRLVLNDWERKNYTIHSPRRWDKKWRILIFDIKETRRELREKLRNTLIAIGFKRLQNSVWVHPYDCEDFITLIKTDFKIGQDLLYIIADSIENGRKLKEYFRLT